MNEKKHVIIYTDGACSGNPGPGGWGAILQYGEHRLEMSGFEGHTTNNRMEADGAHLRPEKAEHPLPGGALFRQRVSD